MRKTEILHLKKYDINFKRHQITVQSAKNHKIRVIDIDTKLALILFFYCRKLKDDELLFKIKSSYVSVIFHKIIQNSKIRKITFHDIRHIYASFLLSKLSNNANAIFVVQQQLGHSSAVETLSTYGYVLSKENKKIVYSLNFL